MDEIRKIDELARQYQNLTKRHWEIKTGLTQNPGDPTPGQVKALYIPVREELYRRLVDIKTAVENRSRPPVPRLVVKRWQDWIVQNRVGATIWEGLYQRTRFGRVIGRLELFARKAGV